MQETKTLVASIAITAGIIIGVVFWGRDYDKEKTSMEVLSFPNPEQVKEEVKEKVKEVEQVIEEKAEEIKQEVEELKELLPSLPTIEKAEEILIKETPVDSTKTSEPETKTEGDE